jgi:opacity protein-like surface antigen
MFVFAATGLKAQTYSVPKAAIHFHVGYTMTLPDLKGTFPKDIQEGKNPMPYFVNNGFNVGLDGKYYLDKKSTFGLILSGTYTRLSSGDIGTSDSTFGVGTHRFDMNLISIGIGAEYDFAPKRPANPFVNLQLTTNIIGGSYEFAASGGSQPSVNYSMTSAIRFGAMFAAGVDVKLSQKIGLVIGGRYHFVNLFGKDSSATTTSEFGLNDKETTTMKARKMPFLQFFAGVSFYLGQPTRKIKK